MQLRIEAVINVLTATFVGLKLGGVIDWPWEWVLSALWIGWVYMTLFIFVVKVRERDRHRRRVNEINQKLAGTVPPRETKESEGDDEQGT
jgi:hypothetical protein